MDEDNKNRTIERINIQQDNIPQLHADWLTPNEMDERGTQPIDKEVRSQMNNLESIEPNKVQQL